jgi:hypothetical protein
MKRAANSNQRGTAISRTQAAQQVQASRTNCAKESKIFVRMDLRDLARAAMMRLRFDQERKDAHGSLFTRHLAFDQGGCVAA